MYNSGVSLYQRRIDYYNSINESLGNASEGNTKWILSLGEIEIYSKKLRKIVKVETKTCVNVVNKAMSLIAQKYPFMMAYIKHSKKMYVPFESEFHPTMAVDYDNNLWINICFVYNDLNFNVDKIFGILFHELMHNFLNHISRSLEVLPEEQRKAILNSPNGKKALNLEHKKMNICMDYEVNANMVADNIVSKNFWEDLGGMNPMSEDVVDGQPISELVKRKMWETIYKKNGNGLLKHYLEKCGQSQDERFLQAMEAIRRYADVLSDPNSSERDILRAREEMNDALDRLYERTSNEKKTIRGALLGLQKTNIKKVRDIADILIALIDDYIVPIEKFNEEDYGKTIEDLETFRKVLKKNNTEICEEFELDEEDLDNRIANVYSSMKTATERIFKENDINKHEKSKLIDDARYAIKNLVADSIAQEENQRAREESERQREQEIEQDRERLREEARKRSILYTIYVRLKNIKSLYTGDSSDRISGETSEAIGKIIDELKDAMTKKTEELKKSDFKETLNVLPKFDEFIMNDIIKLFNDNYYPRMKKSDVEETVKNAVKDLNMCFGGIYSDELSEAEKGGLVSDAYDSLGKIGRMLKAKKITKPSKEFKEAYMKEMKRLQKIYKEYGAEAVLDEIRRANTEEEVE